MTKRDIFTFRIGKDERQMLVELAKKLQRTEGDTLRVLIREAFNSLTS